MERSQLLSDQEKDTAEISNVTRKKLSTECQFSGGPNLKAGTALDYKRTHFGQSLIYVKNDCVLLVREPFGIQMLNSTI